MKIVQTIICTKQKHDVNSDRYIQHRPHNIAYRKIHLGPLGYI